jgi:tyrosyl-tRNA synthetase
MDFDAKINPPRILFNSEWLSRLRFEEVLSLASNMTVQRMLERDMFERRMKEQRPIFMHEFFYPLMQGYDSVAMDVDVELCGTDQIFNALVGRTLQRSYNKKEKFVVAVNLMENPVTGALMSKSRGSGVFLDAAPFDMYGSVMAQPDEMIEVILLNNTRLTAEEMQDVLAMGPRDAKMRVARLVTALFHGEAKAEEAENRFVDVVQKKKVPDEMPVRHVGADRLAALELVLACVEGEISKGETVRLLKQRAIRVDGKVIEDRDAMVTVPPGGVQINVGKRKWYKVIAT